jgi:diacylglycerol kinase family enzyme
VLSTAEIKYIDVGLINENPFFVTCSMAWDASFVRSFNKTRIRGVIPYVFAGVQGLFGYHPQEITVKLDSGERLNFSDVLLFTIANLTQYGAGAKIAPDALADDGYLELVVAMRQDIPKLIANVDRLFDGSIKKIPEIIFKRFKSLTVNRSKAGFIQIDGELISVPAEVKVRVLPKALKVLVPKE